MGINEIAAVAVKKIGIAAGKKMRKKGIKADPLPKTEPTIIKGDSFVSGYAVKEVMPKSITEKNCLVHVTLFSYFYYLIS